MSIASEIARLYSERENIRLAVVAKGAPTAAGTPLAGMPARIAAIPSGGATAPAAFTSGQWTATAGTLSIVVNITALPSDGGSAITALQYRLNGGTWTNFTGTGTGSRTITGLSAISYDVEIRAVNAVGNGAASDIKTRTPAAGGAGEALWVSVTPTTGPLTDTTPLAVNHPAGGTSSQVKVLVITGIETLQFARLNAPAGWTLQYSRFNADNFGVASASGYAIYTAPGDTAAANWTLTAGTGGNVNARWDMHLWSGVNVVSPIRAYAFNDANTWGFDNNMPSPTIDVLAGDGVLAHLFHPQNPTTFTNTPAGYTRVVEASTPGYISTLQRSNAPAGATGTLSHGATGTYEARVAFTLGLAAA